VIIFSKKMRHKRDKSGEVRYISVMPFDPLYTQKLLDYAANISRLGYLERPDAVASANARLCGSSITVEINVAEGVITDYAHRVEACVLGKASAAIVAQHIVGRPVEEVATLYGQMKDFLSTKGPAPTGVWQDLALLESIRPYPQRHASTLLVCEALAKAIVSR
jgi:NifU-like protein involved in Fe-S cluster formation